MSWQKLPRMFIYGLIASMNIAYAQIGLNIKSDESRIGKERILFHQVWPHPTSSEGEYILVDKTIIYYKKYWGDHPGLFATCFVPGDFSSVAKTKKTAKQLLTLLLNKKDASTAADAIERESFEKEETKLSLKDEVYSEFRVCIVNDESGLNLSIFYVYPA